MSRDDFRRRAAAVRDLPLETVLIQRGAHQDRHDKAKWHTEQGPISITGPKFHNWWRGVGGGGAIDLVMHLAEVDCDTAVNWLEQHLAAAVVATEFHAGPPSATSCRSPSTLMDSTPTDSSQSLRLPHRDDRQLQRVRRYLTDHRHLPPELIEPLVESGKLYADGRGNAVFLLVAGKAQRPMGAELRGTGARAWRGMAAGSRKDLGYFWIGIPGARRIVICESAIDAISCHQLHADCIGISTAGARANPKWLRQLFQRGYHIACGFDADSPGDAAAGHMMVLYPTIQRLRPTLHDWNDVLAANHSA